MSNVDLERQRLSARLKEYRKLARMTQKELADKLGKAQTVVSSWEIGTGCPNANELPAIAKALGVSISDICGQTDTKSGDKELLDAYHSADKVTQRNVRLLLGLTDNVDYMTKGGDVICRG